MHEDFMAPRGDRFNSILPQNVYLANLVTHVGSLNPVRSLGKPTINNSYEEHTSKPLREFTI